MTRMIGRRGILGLLAGIPGLIGLGRVADADGLETIGHEIGPFEKPEGWSKTPPLAPAKVAPNHPIFGFQAIEPDPTNGKTQLHTLRVRYLAPKTDAEIAKMRDVMLAQGQDSESVRMAVVALKAEQDTNRLSIQILKAEPSEKRFQTFRAAEDDLFAQVELAPPHWQRELSTRTVNPIMINRAANRIAACTRRGAGNVVLMHTDDLPLIGAISLTDFTEYRNLIIGRWWRVGRLNHSIDVWVTKDLPPGFSRTETHRSVLVGYRGNENDAGGYLVQTPTGYSHLALPNEGSSLGSMSDYLQMVYLQTGEAAA